MQERTDLPRSERIRLMSNMYHHHPAWRAMGQHPAIVEVVKSLYQERRDGDERHGVRQARAARD
eukprot:COSAG04_NODE_3365_length_2884_cov_1.853860_4_plen_64_part_00